MTIDASISLTLSGLIKVNRTKFRAMWSRERYRLIRNRIETPESFLLHIVDISSERVVRHSYIYSTEVCKVVGLSPYNARGWKNGANLPASERSIYLQIRLEQHWGCSDSDENSSMLGLNELTLSILDQ